MLNQSTQEEVMSGITLARDIIQNPYEPRHFMKLKPIQKKIQVWVDEVLLAESKNAIRLLEVGYDLYDPVIYFPFKDLCLELEVIEGKGTFCPIKGDATYYAFPNLTSSETYLAWSYLETLEFAHSLQNLIAFNPEQVSLVELVDKPNA